MMHETMDKLLRLQGHKLFSVSFPVVLPAESNATLSNALDSVVANGNSMGVFTKVFHNRFRASHGFVQLYRHSVLNSYEYGSCAY